MFLGQMRKPDKAAAYKKLRKHITLLGGWILVVRATPYIIHFFQKDSSQELKLEL